MSESTNEGGSEGLLDQLVTAVDCLVPIDGRALLRDDQVAAADKLRELGALAKLAPLLDLADLIAPASGLPQALENFWTLMRAYNPELTLGGADVDPETVRLLHAALQAVISAEPRCPYELGCKLKVAALSGLLTLVRRTWTRAGPDAAQHYRILWSQLEPIEPWYLAHALGCTRSPAECEFGRKGDAFIADAGFLDELLRLIPRKWQAAIAAEVERLNQQVPKEIR